MVEIYGSEWEGWGRTSPYARIDPARMFAFRFLPPGG